MIKENAATGEGKAPRVVVRRQHEFKSRSWGIYVDDKLVEGGYFKQSTAEAEAESYRATPAKSAHSKTR